MSRRDPQGLGYDPVILRYLLDVYSRLLRELNAMRRESSDISELRSIAACVDEMHSKRGSCRRRLDRIECQRHTLARREERHQKRSAQVQA